METTSEMNNAQIPISFPSSSKVPQRRPSLASPSPPTPLFPLTSSATPLIGQRAPPAPLVLPTTSSSQHYESGSSSTGPTPYHYSSKSRPSTAGSRTSARSHSISMPLMPNPQPLGVGVSLSGTGTTAVPPDSPGARAMMKRLLANPSPAGDRPGYTSPVERERDKGYGSPYGITSGSESEGGFGLYASTTGWTRRGTGSPHRVGDSSTQPRKFGSGSESGHGNDYSSFGTRSRHRGWKSTSGEDTNGETELPYYTRSGSASGSQSGSPYSKSLGLNAQQLGLKLGKLSSPPAPPDSDEGTKEKKQRNVLRRRPSARSNTLGEYTVTPDKSIKSHQSRAPSLPVPIPLSPINLSVPIPTIGSISAPHSPKYLYSPPSLALEISGNTLHRSASSSVLKADFAPGSPRQQSSGFAKSSLLSERTINHGATLCPPGQNQQSSGLGGFVGGESASSFRSSKSLSSRGSSPARSPVVSTLMPISRTGSGSSTRDSAGRGKSPIRERHERDLRESVVMKGDIRMQQEKSRVHMTPAEALVAAYKKQEQEEAQRAKEREAEIKRVEEEKKAREDRMKVPTWTPPSKTQDIGSLEGHASSSTDNYMTPANTQTQGSESNGDGSPTPYYTVFGSTSGKVVAVGSPEDSSWHTTYKHGYWDSSVLANKTVTVTAGEKPESKSRGLRTLTRKVSERWKKQSGGGGTVVVGRLEDDLVALGSGSAGVRMSVDSARAQVQIRPKASKSVLGGDGRASMQEKRPSGLTIPSFNPKVSGGSIPRSPVPRSTHTADSDCGSPKRTTLRPKRSALPPHQEHQQQVNRRSLRLSIEKFPAVGGPELPLLPIRCDAPVPKSPRKSHSQGAVPSPQSSTAPQSQQRAYPRNTPGTPTILNSGSASPSTSSIMSQRQLRAPSTPSESVTSSNGATSSPATNSTPTSSSSPGGKFWKLMRRLSVGGLKEKYNESAEAAPPVPPMPAMFAPSSSPTTSFTKQERPGRKEVDSGSPKVSHSQPKRAKSLEAEAVRMARVGASEKPPMPNLPRSSMSSAPPRSPNPKRPSTGVSTAPSRISTPGRPSTTTRSSSPVSSDMGSSKRFFYKAQSGESSTSSLAEDGLSKPPLPIPVGTSPLAQHIIPPPELDSAHDKDDMERRNWEKIRDRKFGDRLDQQEYRYVPPPIPPRTRQLQGLSETNNASTGSRAPSPDIPEFSTNHVINTFKPRTTPTNSPIKSSPTVSLANNFGFSGFDSDAPPILALNLSLPPPPRPARSTARPTPSTGPNASADVAVNPSPYSDDFPQNSTNSGLRRGVSSSAGAPSTSTSRRDDNSNDHPIPRIEQALDTTPVGRKSESHIWDQGAGYAYDTFGQARLATPTASNFGPNTYIKLHYRRSSGGLSTASTARPDGLLRVKRRTNSFGASSLSTTSLMSNVTVEPTEAEDDVAVLKFRELGNDSGPKRVLTEKEKADKWADLLERSAKAGGTLHFAGGSRGW